MESFSGGVYVGKTLCAERASQDLSGAEAQSGARPLWRKRRQPFSTVTGERRVSLACFYFAVIAAEEVRCNISVNSRRRSGAFQLPFSFRRYADS